MDIITLTLFICDFFLPAFALAVVISFVNLRHSCVEPALGLWGRFLVNSGVGCAVLLGGLIIFGQDGKMLTYAALVLVVAASQCLLTRESKCEG
jgi:hypothetical protein